MSNFTINSSYPVPSVMSRTEFEDIIKNLVPASDLIASSDLHISNNKIAIKADGVDIDQLDLASSDSNLEDAGSGKIRVAQTMTGLTSVTSTSFTGALTGNASTATALQTSRTISLGGDLSGSASFDGTSDITLDATVDINSVALGTDTTGNYVAAGATSGSGISGSVSSEGGTFTVTSNATSANTGSTIVLRDSSGDFTAGTITAALTGNASSATTLSAYGTAGQILATNSSANAVEWVDNTPTLEALTDTNIASPMPNDDYILVFDNATDKWVHRNTLNNVLTQMSVGGSAQADIELTVVGEAVVTEELHIGEYTKIKTFDSTDTDPVNGSAEGATGGQTPSTFGSLITGDPEGHVVVQIQGNDQNDGFHVLVPDDPATSTTADKNALRITSGSTVINESGRNHDFRVEGDTNENLLTCDASADAVGIGGAATTGFNLTVHGVMKVAGTGGTELVVQDNSAKAVQVTDGTTGSSQHIRSEGGNCILSLETDITTTSTNNSFVITNSGSETSFTVKDYNTDNLGENADVSFKINHSDATIVLMSVPTYDSELAAGTIYKVGDGSGNWNLKVVG